MFPCFDVLIVLWTFIDKYLAKTAKSEIKKYLELTFKFGFQIELKLNLYFRWTSEIKKYLEGILNSN